MSGRSYLSIGDVLSLLREEFPDVTISKIRFLESQGLVDPERSPSGYRKFYDQDVARLRWVLRKQRDQFLPLRVIRDRLVAAGNGVPPDDDPADARDAGDGAEEGDGAAAGDGADEAGVDWKSRTEAVAVAARVPVSGLVRPSRDTSTHADAGAGGVPAPAHGTNGTAGIAGAARRLGGAGEPPFTHGGAPASDASSAGDVPVVPAFDAGGGAARTRSAMAMAEGERERPLGPDARPAEPVSSVDSTPVSLHASLTGVSLTLAELCAASGLSPQAVSSLEACGLLAPMSIGGGHFYDEEALTVAKVVTAFGRFGIEPRHLRLFRNAAEREVGLIEQVVAPMLRQRNPEARQRAIETAAELAGLGQSLRAALVRHELRRQLGT